MGLDLEQTDYRLVLREAFASRCQRNARYSLRAFARDLGIQPARLSNILNGKKGLSRASAFAVAKKLDLNVHETARFCDLVEAEHARSPQARKTMREKIAEETRLRPGKNLTEDAFRAVSDWYHFAITQLIRLPSYASSDLSPKWMAERLGIQEFQAEEALKRLVRLDLIEEKNGRYETKEESISGPDGVPSAAVRNFHEQLLEKAMKAIHLQSTEERDLNSMIIPVSSRDMDRARLHIRRFVADFTAAFSSSAADRVYALSLQFFNLMSPQVPNLRGTGVTGSLPLKENVPCEL